jgi:hypothetical protein
MSSQTGHCTWSPEYTKDGQQVWNQKLPPKISAESITDSMDRLHHEKHAKFRRWQDAITMNLIFGDNYVSVPEIPKGYEAYAKQWYDKQKPVR